MYLSHAAFAVVITYVFRYEHWVQGGFSKVFAYVAVSGTLAALLCAGAVSIISGPAGKLKSSWLTWFRPRLRPVLGMFQLATAVIWAFGIGAYLLNHWTQLHV